MRKMFRPISKRDLKDTMTVCTPKLDGTYSEPVAIIGVQFQQTDKVSDDKHRSSVSGGIVFVDAVNSKGAFSVPVGSRVCIGGHSYLVREVVTIGDLFSRVHHWELEVG
ncbi:MAG: minor capsid protein [Atopobiaceae bacterium]|nr:minor capsid protein [Atopobiaceae bacterium]